MENRCRIVEVDRLMHPPDSRDHAEGAVAIDLLFFQVRSAFASPERPAFPHRTTVVGKPAGRMS